MASVQHAGKPSDGSMALGGDVPETEEPEERQDKTEVALAIDELAEWLKSVATREGYVDVGFVVVIRAGRVVRKKRIHESVE
jgi:hypothetical protein